MYPQRRGSAQFFDGYHFLRQSPFAIEISSFVEGRQATIVCLYKIKNAAKELYWSMEGVEVDRFSSKTHYLTSPRNYLISSTRHNFSPCWMAHAHLVICELPPKCECTYCSSVDILVIVVVHSPRIINCFSLFAAFIVCSYTMKARPQNLGFQLRFNLNNPGPLFNVSSEMRAYFQPLRGIQGQYWHSILLWESNRHPEQHWNKGFPYLVLMTFSFVFAFCGKHCQIFVFVFIQMKIYE